MRGHVATPPTPYLVDLLALLQPLTRGSGEANTLRACQIHKVQLANLERLPHVGFKPFQAVFTVCSALHKLVELFWGQLLASLVEVRGFALRRRCMEGNRQHSQSPT